MKGLVRTAVFSIMIVCCAFQATAQTKKVKCLVQMNTYMGQGAYIVVSLVNAKGEYEKTLYVMGDDKKWYKTLKEWFKFYQKKSKEVSAVTGASVTSGDRSVTTLEIDASKINKGYTIRFESAVEDKNYYTKDVEIPLTTDGLAAKTEGKGYIKFVKLVPAE